MPFDGAFSPLHWLVVAVIALMVLGPDKLPDAARKSAKAWRELQEMRGVLMGHLRDVTDEVMPTASHGQGAPVVERADPDAIAEPPNRLPRTPEPDATPSPAVKQISDH